MHHSRAFFPHYVDTPWYYGNTVSSKRRATKLTGSQLYQHICLCSAIIFRIVWFHDFRTVLNNNTHTYWLSNTLSFKIQLRKNNDNDLNQTEHLQEYLGRHVKQLEALQLKHWENSPRHCPANDRRSIVENQTSDQQQEDVIRERGG